MASQFGPGNSRKAGTGAKGTPGRRACIAQSAVLAYRQRLSGPEVLLITSKFTRRWVLPKGMIEPGMKPHESAAKEAFEEAGIIGDVASRRIGVFRYMKAGRQELRPCLVSVFPMKVKRELRDWPERRQRRRAWMRLEVALRRVREPQLKQILCTFFAKLLGGAPVEAGFSPAPGVLGCASGNYRLTGHPEQRRGSGSGRK